MQECSLKILGIQDYTVPMFGSVRSMPYGKLYVTDGNEKKLCVIKEEGYLQYITFNRRRYYVKNVGCLYAPEFVFYDINEV